MTQIITPTQAALVVWAAGTVYLALAFYRVMNRMLERDCVCTRSTLHHLSVTLSAMNGLGPAALTVTLVIAGMCWPVLVPYRAVTALRHRRRDLPRCGHCGRALPPPAPAR